MGIISQQPFAASDQNVIGAVLDDDLAHAGKLLSLDSHLELPLLKLKEPAEFLAQPNTTFSIRPEAAIDEGRSVARSGGSINLKKFSSVSLFLKQYKLLRIKWSLGR